MSLSKKTESNKNISNKNIINRLPTFLITKQNNYDTESNKIKNKSFKNEKVKINNNNSKNNDDVNDIIINCNETHKTVPDNVFNYFCNLENNKKNITDKTNNDKNSSDKNNSKNKITRKRPRNTAKRTRRK